MTGPTPLDTLAAFDSVHDRETYCNPCPVCMAAVVRDAARATVPDDLPEGSYVHPSVDEVRHLPGVALNETAVGHLYARAAVPAGPCSCDFPAGACRDTHCRCFHHGYDARPVPAADDRKRATCVCGISVLPENADNHLLRQDGKAHRFPAADADRERLREAVRVMLRDFDRDPTPEYLTSAVDYLLRAGVSPSTGDAERRVKEYVDDVGGPEGVTAEGLRAALTGDDPAVTSVTTAGDFTLEHDAQGQQIITPTGDER